MSFFELVGDPTTSEKLIVTMFEVALITVSVSGQLSKHGLGARCNSIL